MRFRRPNFGLLGMRPLHIQSHAFEDDESPACQQASTALTIYSKLDSSEKAEFLQKFITEGRGKSKDALKFIYTYQRTTSRSKSDTSAATSKMMNRHVLS